MTTNSLQHLKLSCILPVYNEAENLPLFIPALVQTLRDCAIDIELIAIDDGSRDTSLEVLHALQQHYPLTVLQFSRNFGKEAVITAGLAHAHGDATLLIDTDFQHPIELVPTMISLWQNGYDMVYGTRDRNTETWLKRKLTAFFYRVLTLGSSVHMPTDAGDFRLMDRKVVEALQHLPERNRYMKGLYAWVGFKSIGITFTENARLHGTSNFNFMKLAKLALSGITAFTDVPLKICFFFGFFIALASIFYGVFIIAEYLSTGIKVAGWSTLIVAISFLGGIQLLFIGILGEYIGRIYTEVKLRPNYLIADISTAKPLTNTTDYTTAPIADNSATSHGDTFAHAVVNPASRDR